MLDINEIQQALHATRVIQTGVDNPHGPIGLEQLAGALMRIRCDNGSPANDVERSIRLPATTWEKLDALAQQISQRESKPVSASAVASALIVETLQHTKLT